MQIATSLFAEFLLLSFEFFIIEPLRPLITPSAFLSALSIERHGADQNRSQQNHHAQDDFIDSHVALPLIQKAFVMANHQLAVERVNDFEGNACDNQQARTTKVHIQTRDCRCQNRHTGNHREDERA